MFTLEEFVRIFDVNGFQKSNPVFNTQKLDWFNGHYIRQKTDTELTHLVKPFVKLKMSNEKITQILPLVKERLTKLSDFDSLTAFFVAPPSLTRDLWPDPSQASAHLNFAQSNIDHIQQPEFIDQIKSNTWKVGDFFMSLRIAICGSKFTPPISEVIAILGKPESLSRINTALKALS